MLSTARVARTHAHSFADCLFPPLSHAYSGDAWSCPWYAAARA